MKKFIFLILSSILYCSVIYSLEVPDYDGFVTDKAGMLKPKQKKSLEEKLIQYEKATSNEIAVLIVKSLEGEVLEQFSIRVADKWKPGKDGRDNGVLLLISEKDRKLRLEVGDGLTGSLTDLMSGRVLDGEITPKFKEGDFYEGINDGLNLIIKIIDGEFTTEDYQKEKTIDACMTISFIAAIIVSFVGAFSVALGGIFGGAVGGFVGMIFFGVPGLIVGIVIGALVGIIGGLILRGMADSSGSSGGGYYGGGSSSSGGGGSFSFGGGGFSGGGASGGW